MKSAYVWGAGRGGWLGISPLPPLILLLGFFIQKKETLCRLPLYSGFPSNHWSRRRMPTVSDTSSIEGGRLLNEGAGEVLSM